MDMDHCTDEMSPRSNSSSSISPPQLVPESDVLDDIPLKKSAADLQLLPENDQETEPIHPPYSPAITETDFESMYMHYIRQDLKFITGDYKGFDDDDHSWHIKFIDKKSEILYDFYKSIKAKYYESVFEKRRGIIRMNVGWPKTYLIYPKIYKENVIKDARARVKKTAVKKRAPKLKKDETLDLEKDSSIETPETITSPSISKSTSSRRMIQAPKRYLDGEPNPQARKRASGKEPQMKKDKNAFEIGLLPPKYPKQVENSSNTHNSLGPRDTDFLTEMGKNLQSEENASTGLFEISRLLQSGELEKVVFKHKLEELKMKEQLTCYEKMEEPPVEELEVEDQRKGDKGTKQLVEEDKETKDLLKVNLELEEDSTAKLIPPCKKLRQITTRQCTGCEKIVYAFNREDGRMPTTCLSCRPRSNLSSSLLKMNPASISKLQVAPGKISCPRLKAPAEVDKNESSVKKTMPALIPMGPPTLTSILRPPVPGQKEKARTQPQSKKPCGFFPKTLLPLPPPLKSSKKGLLKNGNGLLNKKNSFPKIPQLTGRTFKSPQSQLPIPGAHVLPDAKKFFSMKESRVSSSKEKMEDFLPKLEAMMSQMPMVSKLWPPAPPPLKQFSQQRISKQHYFP